MNEQKNNKKSLAMLISSMTIFSYIDPITALLLSAVILGERMSIFGIIGSVLILGSAIFSEMEK